MQISVWEKETFYAPQDVIIIGSGFVGLWSAFYLKKKHPDRKVTILERGLIPTGASSRNAGFACFGSLSELIYDAKTMGTDAMLEMVEMRFKGLERIRKYFGKGMVDFQLCGGYELYHPGSGAVADELEGNMEYLNSLLRPVTGARQTYQLADDAIDRFGFGQTEHLVKNALEGCLHSGKLLRALLALVHSMGVQVITSVSVQSIERNDNGFEIISNLPLRFSARQVLLCTNAFTKALLPQLDVVPARGQVLLTSPIEGLPLSGTFHSDEGFYYFRNLGNRVLLGGARNKAFEQETTTDMQTSDLIQWELERYLAEVILPRFQGRYTIEQRWAGIMGMGSEKRPIVQELEPGLFCAVRMSGMGVALAPVVGKKVGRMMGKEEKANG